MIQWTALSEALSFYRSLGYRYVETPWVAPEHAITATLPMGARPASISSLGLLVGSAEQSFIAMDMEGKLGKGRFVACTPCFRPGDDDGDLHRPYFMKVELYVNDVIDDTTMFETMGHASAFFRGVLQRSGKAITALRHVQTEEGWDLEIGHVEVGSYGYRRSGGVAWVYGTGCAEPRLSTAVERV